MSFLQIVAFSIMFSIATAIAFTIGGCIFFSSPVERPAADGGGADLCIASLDPQGRPCCLDPERGQCR